MLLSLAWYWQTEDLIDSLQVIYFKVSPVNTGNKWCSFFKWLNSSHILFSATCPETWVTALSWAGGGLLGPRKTSPVCCLPRWSLTAQHCVARSNMCVVRGWDTLTLKLWLKWLVGEEFCPFAPQCLWDTLMVRYTSCLTRSLQGWRLTLAATGCIIWPRFSPLPTFTPLVVCSQLGEWYPSLDSQLVMYLALSSEIQGWDTSEACIKCSLENTARPAWNRAAWNRTVSPVLLAKTSLCQAIHSPAPDMWVKPNWGQKNHPAEPRLAHGLFKCYGLKPLGSGVATYSSHIYSKAEIVTPAACRLTRWIKMLDPWMIHWVKIFEVKRIFWELLFRAYSYWSKR